MLAKQRQLQNTLQQTLLTNQFSNHVNIISSDFVDGTFARSVIKMNYQNLANRPTEAEEMQCDQPLASTPDISYWAEWSTPVPETCGIGCGGARERNRQCTQCSSSSCGFERLKPTCTVFEVEQLVCEQNRKFENILYAKILDFRFCILLSFTTSFIQLHLS